MVCDFVNGLAKWASIHACDRHLDEPSSTLVEKSKQEAAKHLHKAHRRGRSDISSHTFSPLGLLLWTSLFFGARTQLTDPFPTKFELSSLDGTNGFIINGEAADDYSGYSVSSAGDMNGDGLSDLVIGAYRAAPSGRSLAGKSYVIYGSRTLMSRGTLELSSLDGTNGFILNGEAGGDYSGFSVSSAGDMNGDDLSDLVIGTYSAGPTGRFAAGKSYVIYGSRTPLSSGSLELSSLNGSNGFILNGEAEDDFSGRSVSSAGDMNGDGLSDLVIGAHYADPSGRSQAGKSYVIYGSRTPSSSGIFELSSLNGSNGLILNGESADDESGYSVSSAGDMNGDGLSDLVIGAYYADPSGKDKAGKSYVIYGSRTPLSSGTLELSSLDGSNGFILNGEAAGDWSGVSVSSAGDMNGDGLSDLVIGAYRAYPSGRSLAGKSYVIYGSRTPLSGGTLELSSLNGTNGFIIKGEAAGDSSGRSVSSAGDMNGDGLSDLVIGAYYADPSGMSKAGKSYVIYGSRTPLSSGTLELSSLDGTHGFVLNGEMRDDRSGVSVSSAGDMNGDGLSDLVIGAHLAAPSGKREAGKSYVIYGNRTPLSSGTLDLSNLDGINGFIINGEAASGRSGYSVSSAGDMNGDSLVDLVIGANRANLLGKERAGKSYVIYGRNVTQSQSSPLSLPGTTLILPTPATSAPQISTTTEKLPVASKEISSPQFPPSMISLPQSPDARSPTSSSSIPLIVGIAAAVTALACSVLGGIVMYKKKRSPIKTSNPDTSLNTVHPDPELPAGYVDISKIQTEMHSARVENEYAVLPQSKPSSHYNQWPKGEAPHTPDQYDKVSLEKLNDQQAQYDDAKMAAIHANYDEIPTV